MRTIGGCRPVSRSRGLAGRLRGPALAGDRVRRGGADHRGPRLSPRLAAPPRTPPTSARGGACGRADRAPRRPRSATARRRRRRRSSPISPSAGYAAWVFDAGRQAGDAGGRAKRRARRGPRRTSAPSAVAATGTRTVDELPGGVTTVTHAGVPRGRARRRGAGPLRAPAGLQDAIEDVRGNRLTALGDRGRRRDADRLPRRQRDHLAGQAPRRRARAGSPRAASTSRSRAPAAATRSPISARALETMRLALRETFEALSSERDRLSAIFDALDEAVHRRRPGRRRPLRQPGRGDLIDSDGEVVERCRPWLRRADPPGRRRERRASRRRPRLRDRRAQAAGRGRGAGRRPRPHRGAAPRDRRARVRLQRGARAAQPDRRHLRRDRGPARRAPRTTPRRASTSSPGWPPTPSGSAG